MSEASTGIAIDRLDHFVLTVRDIEASCAFYSRVLNARIENFQGRVALGFGRWKVNLHRAGHEFEPKAAHPAPGTGDFCLITTLPMDEILRRLKACGVAVELGPVPRTGAMGAMQSVYFRDPDGNLVEVAHYA